MTRHELLQAISGRRIFLYYGAGYVQVTRKALTLAIKNNKSKIAETVVVGEIDGAVFVHLTA